MMYTVHVEVGTLTCLPEETCASDCCTVVGATSMHELVIIDQPWQPERYELVSHSSATETDGPSTTTTTEGDHSQDSQDGHLEVTDVKMLSALQVTCALVILTLCPELQNILLSTLNLCVRPLLDMED
jgi:hypothetical protein